MSLRVDALVQRAMAKNPDDRFRSMAALVVALEACLAEEGGVAALARRERHARRSSRPVSPDRERRAQERRRRAFRGVLVLIAR